MLGSNYQHIELPPDYKKAFKDADIRGRYETEVNEVLAYRIARAFVEYFGLSQVLIGRDMRSSSPSMAAAFIAGVRDSGALAIDIGLVTTPMLYFSSGSDSLPGVMITASHNPAAYNGLKLVLPGAIPITNKTGLLDILKMVSQDRFAKPKKTGGLKKKSLTRSYESFIRKTVLPPPRPGLKMVADMGNGMGALLLPQLKRYAKVTPLFLKLDGRFPNRASDPTLKKNQKAVRAAVQTGAYDLGIAFDGDADRVAFFDERGRYINAAHIGAMLVDAFSESGSKLGFVYTALNSRIFLDTINQRGGRAILAPVGHAFIKEKMRAHDAYFGCENSAHFYFKDNFYADSSIMTVVHVLAALEKAKKAGHSFSELMKPYARYYQTEEVLLEVQDKDLALQELVNWVRKTGGQVSTTDGISIEFPDWWAMVRKSVTEDALKFVVESSAPAVARIEKKRIQEFLDQYKRL